MEDQNSLRERDFVAVETLLRVIVANVRAEFQPHE